MKKQKILYSLWIVIALLLLVTNSAFATNEKINLNTANTLESNQTNNTDIVNETRNLLSSVQVENADESIDTIREKIIVVIIAFIIAVIFILIIWKYEFKY